MCRVLVTYAQSEDIEVFNVEDELKAVSVSLTTNINNTNLEFITFVDKHGLVSIRKEYVLQIQVME